MEKLLKNLHWLIIALAAFNCFTAYTELEERQQMIVGQQESERTALLRNKKSQREIAAFYENIKEAKDRIEKVALEIERAQQLLPSEIADTENISLLRKIAEDVNIKDISIAPDKESDKGFYISRSYRFKAKATYLQFLIMFEKISENKRILNVGELTFKKLAQPQRSKFQLIDGEFILEAYRYNPNFREDRGIDEIEKKFKEGEVPRKKS